MPGATFAVMEAEVRQRVGSRSTMGLSQVQIHDRIRDSLVQLSSPKVHRHAELELLFSINTVDGSAGGASADEIAGRYDLPTAANQDLWTIFTVRDTTTTNIRRLRPAGVGRIDEVTQSFGPPIWYVRWGTQLQLDPVPNGVFAIQVRAYAHPLPNTDARNTVLAGSCPLHQRFDEGVILGAEWRCWMNLLQNPARGKMVQNQLVDWSETIISPYEGELDDQEDLLAVDMTGQTGGSGYNG